MNLSWGTSKSLENSFVEFIQDAVTSASLTVPDENGDAKSVTVRVGQEFNKNWSLPVISIYADSKLYPRLSIGSNKRQKSYLIIIDIRTLDSGSQADLTTWVEDIINDGVPFYNYTPNPSDPLNPTKVANGLVSVDFVSNIQLRLGENVEIYDKNRQNITLSVTISNS